MPPPSILRTLRISRTRAASPHTREPTGAPSPFERQNATVSAQAAISAGSTPDAQAALNSRAPSRCTRRPRSRAAVLTRCSWANGHTLPPDVLWVFSIASAVAGA
jgi:hypothetical protein